MIFEQQIIIDSVYTDTPELKEQEWHALSFVSCQIQIFPHYIFWCPMSWPVWMSDEEMTQQIYHAELLGCE